MSSKQVRFGLHSGQQYERFGEIQDLWRAAESLGFDLMSVFDHLRPPLGGADGPCFEGLTLLSAMAASTSRIRCVMLVSAATWRHPAIAAAAASTIDHVSGGRVEFGMGAGGPDLGYQQYGIPFPSRASRLEMLGEACQILRGLWDGSEISMRGRHFQIDRAYLRPKPLQAHLPLVIGGESDEILALVARHADVWNTIVTSLDDYRRKLSRLTIHCERVGRDPAEIRKSLTFRTLIVAGANSLDRRKEELAATFAPEVLREFLTYGGQDECADQLRAYRRLGVDDFILGARPPIDWETVELFATEVIPAVRETL